MLVFINDLPDLPPVPSKKKRFNHPTPKIRYFILGSLVTFCSVMARLNGKWLTVIGTSLVIPYEIGTKKSFLVGFPVFCLHVTDLVNNNIKKTSLFI